MKLIKLIAIQFVLLSLVACGGASESSDTSKDVAQAPLVFRETERFAQS